MSSRPGYVYIVLVTSSSDFRPPSSSNNPKHESPASKYTAIDNVLCDREQANIFAKEYFLRQYPDDNPENEDEASRIEKWGLWVPSRTTKCTIKRQAGLCAVKVVMMGKGVGGREEVLVEVVEEEILDAVESD